jgi:transcriptional regulator with XRE-family HTH domain
MSQAHLAKLAGVTQHTVSDAESGRRAPRTSTLVKLAEALGVPVVALFSSEPTRRSLLELAEELVVLLERFAANPGRYSDSLEAMKAAAINATAATKAVQQLAVALSRGKVPPTRLKDAEELTRRLRDASGRFMDEAVGAAHAHRTSPGESWQKLPDPDPELAQLVEQLEAEGRSLVAEGSTAA